MLTGSGSSRQGQVTSSSSDFVSLSWPLLAALNRQRVAKQKQSFQSPVLSITKQIWRVRAESLNAGLGRSCYSSHFTDEKTEVQRG